MSATLKNIYAPLPAVTRGQPIHIGGDPKGINILYCVEKNVVIRNTKDILQADLYQEHTHATAVARYAPSGFYIASADVQGKEHILKGEYSMLSGAAFDLAWSDDSKRIIIAGQGREKFASVFMFDTGASVGEITGHSKTIWSCDFKQTRPYRVVTGGEDMFVNWFEGPPFKFKSSFREHQRFVTCVRFAPDGSKYISVGQDKKGFVFDGKTGDKIGELSAENGHTLGIYSISWAPNSKQFITASADKTAKLWDAETYKVLKTFKFGNDTEDQQLGCLWNGDLLFSVALSGNISILDLDNPDKPKKIIRGHNKLITCLSYDKVDRKLYSGDFSGKLVQWDIDTADAEEFSGQGHKNQVSAVRVSGGHVTTVSMDDSIKTSDAGAKQWGASVDLGTQPSAVDVAKGAAVVAAGETLIVVRNNTVVSKDKIKYFATSVAVSPDGVEVAVGGKDMKVHLYTLDGDKLKEKSELSGHRGEVTAVAYSHDGTYLASGDGNREVKVWKNGTSVVDGWVFHTARINSVAWAPDNNHLASVSTDGNFIVWNVANPGNRVMYKNAHFGGVNAVAWIDDNTVATGGQDCAVKTWSLKY